MPTEKQKQLVELMIPKFKKLRELGHSDKELEQILRDLDLPLGAHLYILRKLGRNK